MNRKCNNNLFDDVRVGKSNSVFLRVMRNKALDACSTANINEYIVLSLEMTNLSSGAG